MKTIRSSHVCTLSGHPQWLMLLSDDEVIVPESQCQNEKEEDLRQC